MARPARRRPNGDGSVTRRADGRWMGRFYAWTAAGTRKRVTVYGRTRQEAADRMREAQERNRQGVPGARTGLEARRLARLLARARCGP